MEIKSLISFIFQLILIIDHQIFTHAQQPNGGQPKVWLTVSSVVDKVRINGVKYISQRKLELNWLNVPTSGAIHTIALFNHDPLGNPKTVIPSSDDALVSLQPKLVGKGRFRSDIQFPIKLFTPTNLTADCLGYYVVLWNEEDGVKASNCLRAHPYWMRDHFDSLKDKAVKDIMIPGTHNAASYEIGFTPDTRSIIKKYVICHDESIFNQLAYGIRYLDIRISHEPVIGRKERLWIVHGILRTEITLAEILVQVRAFLDATTHEIVILDFHRFEKGFEDYPRDEMANLLTKIRHQEVYRLLEQHLAPHISRDHVGYNVKVGDLIRDGKRLIIGYAGNRFIRDANYYPRVRHLWAEAENVTSLEDYFHRMICAPSGFEATSAMAQLTPTTWGVIFDKYGGLRKMAQDVNWIITNWFEEKWWTCVNIVASDFFLGNNLIEISIEANKRRPNVPMRRFKRSQIDGTTGYGSLDGIISYGSLDGVGFISNGNVISNRIIDGQLVDETMISESAINEDLLMSAGSLMNPDSISGGSLMNPDSISGGSLMVPDSIGGGSLMVPDSIGGGPLISEETTFQELINQDSINYDLFNETDSNSDLHSIWA